MPKKASASTQGKTVMDRMVEVNPFTPWGKNVAETSNKSVTAMAETMREMVMNEMMMDMIDQTAENRLRRQEERSKDRDKRLQGGSASGVNPMAKFMEGFSDPNWLNTWTQMDPEQQQQVMNMISSYGMMNQTQASMMNPMMYQYMLMQQQKPGSEIKVTDLINMFTGGMKEALELAKANQTQQPQTSPMEMFDAMSKVIAPFTQKADDATSRTFQILMEQMKIQKSGGMNEALLNIKEVMDTFGGGGTSQADIEIARLQSQNAFQMAQLQADMQIRAEEMRAENTKWEQIGGLALTGLGAVGPAIAQGMKTMGQQAAHTAGVQADPTRTMPPMQRSIPGAPAPAYAEVTCGECNHPFQVRLGPNGQPPRMIECPACHEKLEAA